MKNPNTLSFKARLNIHYLLCLVGAVVMMWGSQYSGPSNLHSILILGILILASGLIFRILYVRCPHCGDGLYQPHADLKTCPKCGKKLQ
jgi:ssDNA-binding Zn-finger/Zn-ribbon topoisomerase 1